MFTQTGDLENELTTTLYAQHQAALRAFVVRRKIPRAFQATHSPEDVPQHVWQQALPHLRAVHDSGQAGVLPYLLSIARNHLGRMWGIVSKRRKRANPETELRANRSPDRRQGGSDQASSNAGPLDELVAAEGQASFEAALAVLPSDERRAIGLKRQGCSREQIAALLDRSPESIHGLLRHAYARLRRKLAPLGTGRK